MIPEEWVTLLTFLGLVAPGLVLQVVLEAASPRIEETTFREASRVALSNFGFTLAALILCALARWIVPNVFPDLIALQEDGWAYVAAHPAKVLWPLLAIPLVASGLAAASGLIFTRDLSSTLSAHGAWYQTLRLDRPEETVPWMHIRLKDDAEYWGHLRHYTEDDSADVREIVLGGRALACRSRQSPPNSKPEVIGNKWGP